jgi:peptidyl-prolyl cis-trans isomerase A (cyclophilin A)
VACVLFLLTLISVPTSTEASTPKPTPTPTPIPNAIVPMGGKGLTVNLNKYLSFKIPTSSTNPVSSNNVLVSTTMGNFVIQLFPTNAPNTVANFLDYATNGYYNSVFFHRAVTNFIIQSGGYSAASVSLPAITNLGTIPSEFGIPNTRGTVAMALGANSQGQTDPNSASSQWFINLTDNSTTLDSTNNGPFTVFGKIVGTNGLSVADKISQLPLDSFANFFGTNTPFTSVPLQNWNTNPANVSLSNLVTITKIQQVALPAATATSSDSNSFTTTIQGNNLIVTPHAINTAPVTISVLATDTNGNAADLSFQVSTGRLHQSIYFPPLDVSYSVNGLSLNSIPFSSTSGDNASIRLNSGPGYFVGSTIFFKNPGVISMTISTLPGDFFYFPASATGYIIVSPATQTISFPTIPNQTNFTSAYSLPLVTNYPTSSSGLPVSLTVQPGSPANLVGKSLRISGAGTITLIAKQPGNANYYAAKPLTNSFTVTLKP